MTFVSKQVQTRTPKLSVTWIRHTSSFVQRVPRSAFGSFVPRDETTRLPGLAPDGPALIGAGPLSQDMFKAAQNTCCTAGGGEEDGGEPTLHTESRTVEMPEPRSDFLRPQVVWKRCGSPPPAPKSLRFLFSKRDRW